MRGRLFAWMAGLALVASPSLVAALEPCQDDCAEVSVGSGNVRQGESITLPVNFTQGPNDQQPGEGNDEVAAIAFTIGIPGTGEGTPLRLSDGDCQDANADGLPDGVTVGSEIRDGFRVVVENVECIDGSCGCGPSRDRCLCPGAGQSRDDFMNVVAFGPKVLPAEGPVDIPILPDSAELLSVRLTALRDAPLGQVPIHVFAETDEAPIVKPQFAANLSIGDQSAIDQTADRAADRSKVSFNDGTVTIGPGIAICFGDCNLSGLVEVSDLITGVNVALGNMTVGACSALDINEDGVITIDELITAVNNSLNDCQ